MKTTINKTDKHVNFSVIFDGDEYRSAVDSVLIEQGKMMTVDGYEQGEAPLEIVKQKLGADLYYEAGNRLIDTYFQEIISSVDDTLVYANVDVKEFTDDYIEMIIAADKEPVVSLNKYMGLEVTAPAIKDVDDKDIERGLIDLQQQYAYFVTKDIDDVVEMGDIATIDYEGFKDGVAFAGGTAKGYDLGIGSHSFIPGFEEGLVGMKIEETREIPLTFPEQYHSAELAGAEVIFKVTVHGIKSRKLPEINDELAENRGLTTLDELKESIKEGILGQRRAEAAQQLSEALMDQLIEHNDVELTEGMIQNQMRTMVNNYQAQLQQQGMALQQILQLNGTTYEEFLETVREPAVKNLKSGLILRAITAKENITATEDEINQSLSQIAAQYGMPLDQFIQAVGPNLEQMKESLVQEVTYNKALEFVRDHANIH